MSSLTDLGPFSLFHPLLQTAAFFVGLTSVYVIMQTLHPRKPNLFSLDTDRGVKTHMTLGAIYVSVLLFGFLIGPLAMVLAGITPFRTLHSYVGIAVAGLVVAGGSLGLRLSRRRGACAIHPYGHPADKFDVAGIASRYRNPLPDSLTVRMWSYPLLRDRCWPRLEADVCSPLLRRID